MDEAPTGEVDPQSGPLAVACGLAIQAVVFVLPTWFVFGLVDLRNFLPGTLAALSLGVIVATVAGIERLAGGRRAWRVPAAALTWIVCFLLFPPEIRKGHVGREQKWAGWRRVKDEPELGETLCRVRAVLFEVNPVLGEKKEA